jgi:hypothetical protein
MFAKKDDQSAAESWLCHVEWFTKAVTLQVEMQAALMQLQSSRTKRRRAMLLKIDGVPDGQQRFLAQQEFFANPQEHMGFAPPATSGPSCAEAQTRWSSGSRFVSLGDCRCCDLCSSRSGVRLRGAGNRCGQDSAGDRVAGHC